MSLTVKDCLQIGNLKYGTVVAGFQGLARPVESVTVAEVPYAPPNQLYGSELVLSALYLVKNDVKLQCELIRKLNKAGVSALVIFYLGIYLDELSQQLIDTANELEFPLIIMPENSMDFAYVDAIKPVIEAIMEEKRKDIRLFDSILDDLCMLPQEKRDLKAVLKKSVEALNCSIILADNLFKPLEWHLCPEFYGLDVMEVCQQCQQADIETLEKKINVSIAVDCADVYIEAQIVPIDIRNFKFGFLVALREKNTSAIPTYELQQIVEAIKIFMHIWQYSSQARSDFEYVNLIVSGRLSESGTLHSKDRTVSNSEKIDGMCVIKLASKDENIVQNAYGVKALNTIKILLRNYSYGSFVSFYGDSIVILLSQAYTSKNARALLSQIGYLLAKELYDRFGMSVIIGISDALRDSDEASGTYRTLNETIYLSKCIYPEKSVFFTRDMLIPRLCLNLLNHPGGYVNEVVKLLEPVKAFDKEHGTNYLHTLEVFLLDCECSMKKTSKKLFIHLNTLKYRIKKLENIFKMDMDGWPEKMEIILAAALSRILDNNTP